MHELSIAMSIVDLAAAQAANHEALVIEEIELDIGCLSGVEMDSFDFAWRQAIKRTILENATRKVNRIEGKAHCLECGCFFNINTSMIAVPSVTVIFQRSSAEKN